MTQLGSHAVKVKGPDDGVWYFLTPDGHENRLKIYAATMTPERATEVAGQIVDRNPGYQAKAVELCPYVTPGWLRERNNDPYGTPNKIMVAGELVDNPFWQDVQAELVGVWKLFERDGWWFGYKTTQNAWAHFRTEAEARERAAGPQVDVWA